MTTERESAAERNSDVETILRLMAKHDWTRLTIRSDGFALSRDDVEDSLVIGVFAEGGK